MLLSFIKPQKTSHYIILISLLSAVLVIEVAILFAASAAKVNAADAKKFDKEILISQSAFTNSKSMSSSDIQKFLNDKNSVCLKNYNGLALIDANKNGQIEDWISSEQYGGSTGKQTMTAAQLIKAAADIYGINPQVLLVTLQKEQGLITRSDCPTWRYNTAFGFGCPDTAPCDSAAYGFTRQIDNAAYHFKNYMTGRDALGYSVYATFKTGSQGISYHPGPCKIWNSDDSCKVWQGSYGDVRDNTYCGKPAVNIRNLATASLYTYTPYQPNQAALDAGYGTANNECSSYGNRNFYMYFTDWFGSTRMEYQPLDKPRWMELNTDTYKYDPGTGKVVDSILPKGLHLKFISKVYVDGKWYLRSEWDHNRGYAKGIPIENVNNIAYASFIQPRWMQLKETASKVDPLTGKTAARYDKKLRIFFNSKITVNGQTYYRTAYNTGKNESEAFNASVVEEVTYDTLDTPRWMRFNQDTPAKNLLHQNIVSTQSVVTKNNDEYFDTKILLNGVWYLRSSKATQANSHLGFPLSSLDNIPLVFTPFDTPRTMTLTESTRKQDPETGAFVDTEHSPHQAGAQIHFSTKIFIGNEWYARSTYDTNNGYLKVIPLSKLEG